MEFILIWIGIFFFGFIVKLLFGLLKVGGSAAKATIDSATGRSSFSDSFKETMQGFGDFKFKVLKQTNTEAGKSNDIFVMQFKGLFPSNLNNRKLSFIFNIFDETNEQDPSVITCPIAGFNEGSSTTYQFIRPVGPVQTDHGYSDWVTIGIAPLEFLKFPKKGQLKLKFQCCITLEGNEPEFNLGGVLDNSSILRVFTFKLDFYNSNTGYLEISESRKIVEKTIIEFGFYLSSVDGEIDKKEGLLIKDWCKNIVSSSPSGKTEETKKRLNADVTNALNLANNQDLSLSNIVKNFNNHASKVEKYEGLELGLKIMQADGKADKKELDTLDKISREIKIDPEEYKKLREQSLATVDIITEKETVLNSGTVERKDELARVIGFNVDDSKETIRKILITEGKKWRSRVNVSDDKIKINANNMLQLIAEARKTFLND